MLLKAKPYHSLVGHLEDAHRVFQNYYSTVQRSLDKVTNRVMVDSDEMRFYHALGVYGHDFGKGIKKWQLYIRDKHSQITHSLFSFAVLWEIVSKWTNPIEDCLVRNMLLAVLAHHSMLHEHSYERYKSLGTISVPNALTNEMIAHFWDLEETADIKSKVNLSESETTWITADIINRIKLLRTKKEQIELSSQTDLLIEKQLHGLFLRTICLCDNVSSKISQKLHQKNKLFLEFPCVNDENLHQYALQWIPSVEKLFQEVKVFNTPNRMQEKLLNQMSAQMILKAGCGEGKTAAALLFARHFIESGEAERVIFTMPTKFTSNSMLYDFVDKEKYGLPEGMVGLYHSEADKILRGIHEQDEEKDRHDEDEFGLDAFYQRPVTISTIDHLLYSLLHCHKYADRAFGNISRAVVIFDEVHYYDIALLQKIGQTLQLLRQLNIPHLLMTATLPQVIEKKIQGRKGTRYVTVTSDGKNEDQSRLKEPFSVVKIDEPLVTNEIGLGQKAWSIIEENIDYRQMIVVNQVEKAKQIYYQIQKRFPDKNMVCYHSEFAPKDRAETEKVIKAMFSTKQDEEQINFLQEKGYKVNTQQAILVTTQVCELSLDISSDIQLTELAPVDALGQRGGRLHRKGEAVTKASCQCSICRNSRVPSSYEYRQYVFALDEENPYSYLPYVEPERDTSDKYVIPDHNILDLSWEVIGGNYSFPEVADWVNTVYEHFLNDLGKPLLLLDDKMRDYIKEDVIFGRKVKERFGNEAEENSQGSFQVREGILKTYAVVPKVYLEELSEKFFNTNSIKAKYNKKELFESISQHSVNINLYKFHRVNQNGNLSTIERFGIQILVLNLPYDGDGAGIDFSAMHQDDQNEIQLPSPIL